MGKKDKNVLLERVRRLEKEKEETKSKPQDMRKTLDILAEQLINLAKKIDELSATKRRRKRKLENNTKEHFLPYWREQDNGP